MFLRIALTILFSIIPSLLNGADSVPDFSRDILPILSENCFSCHGPDVADRRSDLRLDSRDGFLKSISVENVDKSEFLLRIESSDPDLLMPPASSHKKALRKDQIDILKRWIQADAPWGKHWALELPVKVSLDEKAESHPIDQLVSKRLQREGLAIGVQAPVHTLKRRLAFDITGLPPSIDSRKIDSNPKSIELYIDDLLASPHYGERMAMWWLDAARYSDTDGYQADATRTNWPWRDWVVDAFRENMPFDQFTIEQFAGDLLPNATPEQRLATCFHRNHMANGEGGRHPEESRVDYVIDRVNTVGTLWLGMTLGCCQCHSHKFDPISQSDYYSLTAFFNSIDEDGKAGGGAKPFLEYQSSRAKQAVDEARKLVDERKPLEVAARKQAEAPFRQWLSEKANEKHSDYEAWKVIPATKLESTEGTRFTQESDGTIQTSGPNPNQDDYRFYGSVKGSRVTGIKLEIFPHESHTDGGLSRGSSGEIVLTNVKMQVHRQGDSQLRDILIQSAVADYSADKKANNNYGDVKDTLDDDPRNGWSTKGSSKTEKHVAIFAMAEPLLLDDDEEIVIELRHRSTLGDANIGRFRILYCDELGDAVRTIESTPMEQLAKSKEPAPEKMDGKLRKRLFEQFLEDHHPYRAPKESLVRAEKQLQEVKQSAEKLKVMVLEERKEPRDTFVLVRGVWDQHGEKVDRNVPTSIAHWPQGEDYTRLGLARWIVSRQNPLTARVFVNHVWQMFFGVGLVKTPEDFGLQGDRAIFPELLDWLAVDFMEHGWDVKRLIKQIVSSQVYQQTSVATEEAIKKDPENRLLARGARYRLPSWMLRDAALQASGLLNTTVGGPPVRPYQPEGVWEELFMGRFHYEPSEGDAQYRRSLYAFWRRTIAPTYLFDSAQRRVCEVRLARTNTPLQALTLLNDTTYLEASRALATQVLMENTDTSACLQAIAKRVLTRELSKSEITVLQTQRQRAQEYYAKNPDMAKKFITIGQRPPDPRIATEDLASMMLIASMVFNLDEAMTHE